MDEADIFWEDEIEREVIEGLLESEYH